MRDDEIELVFAGLGENVGKRLVGEVLELVDIKIKRGQCMQHLGGNVGARHGCEINLGDEHGAQQCRIDLAHAALGKVHNQDLFLIHDLPDVERGLGLADDVADERVAGKLPYFILYGRRGVLGVAVGIVGKLVYPKTLYDRVFDVLHYLFAKCLVDEHPVDVKQCCARELQQRQQRVGKYVFHARAPGVDPDFAES